MSLPVILNIVLCLFLVVIIVQDFTRRAIHVLVLLGIFVCSLFILYVSNHQWTDFMFSVLFLLLVLALLWLYVSIKNKKTTNPFKKDIGLGDILFFFAVTPLFGFEEYLLFFVSGMLITILYHLIAKIKLIPLAGILGAYLLVLKILSFWIGFSLLNFKMLDI